MDGDGDLDIANVNSGSAGFTILKNSCSGETCTCGNGGLDGREACDDGATGSAFCDPDCTLRSCGDGFVNTLAGEQCDDGNAIDDDACDTGCVAATCTDGAKNQGETDVDCGGPCESGCAARKVCVTGDDCQSGAARARLCAYGADFEDGLIPAAFSTGPTNPWLIDATDPISDSTRSLISHDFTVQGSASSTSGNSSVFLQATFGPGGGRLIYDVQTNCSFASVLVLRIDGTKVVELYGRRLQLDDGYTDSYDVPAGTHTFEWRYESKIGSGEGLLFPPFHRAWIDDVILINGAPLSRPARLGAAGSSARAPSPRRSSTLFDRLFRRRPEACAGWRERRSVVVVSDDADVDGRSLISGRGEATPFALTKRASSMPSAASMTRASRNDDVELGRRVSSTEFAPPTENQLGGRRNRLGGARVRAT